MAKRQKVKRFSVMAWDNAHYRQTDEYTRAVDVLFDRATAEITKAAARGKYDPDKPFSFDDYPSVQSVMQKVVAGLTKKVTTVIESGSKKQWLFACAKNDGFIASIMDTSKISKARLKKMQDRNLDALHTFQTRKIEGMNLSQRVWKYTKQYKDQIEVALDVGLGEGRSAQELARDVKQNLKEPDNLFRRVRDKRGNLVLSRRARAFHPGQGVYRSSVKNAQRLTRSEINMAYRESDFLRWQQLDFVVGYEVKRSNHEPLCKCDICAKLVGRYPKWIKFKGWHPQCMCYAVPILMDEETFEANELGDLKAALHGTKYKKLAAKNGVPDVPKGFHDWVDAHKEAQKNWSSTPYFIRDNFIDGDLSKGLKPMFPTIKTPLQLAEERHEARSPEYVKEVQGKWLQRAKDMGNALVKEIHDGGFDILGIDTKQLQRAINGKDVEEIQNRTQEARATMEKMKQDIIAKANAMLTEAEQWKDIDSSTLKNQMKGTDFFMISEETKNLKMEIDDLKKKVADLGVYIPDVMKWHDKFTFDELEKTRAGVERTLGMMPSDLPGRKSKLEFEIDWVEKHKKYSTWAVAKSAYEKELDHVKRKIEEKKIADDVTVALAVATTSRSTAFKAMADEMRVILSTPGFDLTKARQKADELIKKQKEIESRRKKTLSKDAKVDGSVAVARESLDDLKKRLGTSMPKTLAKLDTAIKRFERTRSYGQKAKDHKDEIEDLMRKVFDIHDYGMNIDEDVVEKVLTSWFKNTFEVGGGNGYVGSHKTTGKIESSHARLSAAHKLFGLPQKDLQADQLERKEYEKYGNLLDHDILHSLRSNTATQYGRVEVRFKKGKVIPTWTAGDSLGAKWQPSLCSDPKSCSFDDYYNTPTTNQEDVTDLQKFKNNHIARYLELQYHGDLTVDCVESIAFPYDILDTSRSREYAIGLKWKNAGVKVYFIKDDGTLGQL